MKIALLSNASSIHTIQWANRLSAAGVQIYLISQHPVLGGLSPHVKTYIYPNRGFLGYFQMVPHLAKLLQQVQPDLLNAHYASGYGTTARLVNFRPWMLSVWGSDVYSVPYKSFLHEWWITGNLKAADTVASTSHCMARQARSLTADLDSMNITPFGVDMKIFSNEFNDHERNFLTIGTIKTLKHIYGIDILIRAFAILKNMLAAEDANNKEKICLRIVGSGKQQLELEQLAKSLDLSDSVEFIGQVKHSQVPNELANLDIYVALSRSESFGVAVIEASAMGLPVLVSDAEGLAEVVISGHTGLVVPKDNPEAAAQALYRLACDKALRRRLGEAGKQHVAEHYSWTTCVQKMLSAYEDTIFNYEISRKKIS